MPICRVAWSLTGALLIVSAAVAQEQVAPLSLPQLEKCDGASRPRLPEKWRGSYLMAPFTNSQLVLAEIVSDQPLSAMRVKLYGVRRGSADLLVLGTNTYLLESDGAAIQCRSLGDTGWRRNARAPARSVRQPSIGGRPQSCPSRPVIGSGTRLPTDRRFVSCFHSQATGYRF
jgi:hypothetical protein